jgi:hypothetical protein
MTHFFAEPFEHYLLQSYFGANWAVPVIFLRRATPRLGRSLAGAFPEYRKFLLRNQSVLL